MATDFKVTKSWVLAGSAIFTVHNADNEHYTFRVARKDPNPQELNPATGRPWSTEPVWFVSVLCGPENTVDYAYLGVLEGRDGPAPWVRTTRKSKFPPEGKVTRVARWALAVIWNEWWDRVPEGYGIHHEGRCGRCGRTLTHPDGVDPEGYRFGYGPECWGRVKTMAVGGGV